MKNITLSVLILSITERFEMLQTLVKKLESNCKFDDVEILVLLDNRKQTITEKRNKLLSNCKGKYLTFLDDDDDVFDNYFEEIVPICREDKYDVITFDQHCDVNGFEFTVDFSLGNPIEPVNYSYLKLNPSYKVKRPPWHNCVWKTEIAASEPFIEIRNEHNESCEDADWIGKLTKKVSSSYKINEKLHKYLYRSSISRSAS